MGFLVRKFAPSTLSAHTFFFNFKFNSFSLLLIKFYRSETLNSFFKDLAAKMPRNYKPKEILERPPIKHKQSDVDAALHSVKTGSSIRFAAKQIGMDESTLRKKIKRLSLALDDVSKNPMFRGYFFLIIFNRT